MPIARQYRQSVATHTIWTLISASIKRYSSRDFFFFCDLHEKSKSENFSPGMRDLHAPFEISHLSVKAQSTFFVRFCQIYFFGVILCFFWSKNITVFSLLVSSFWMFRKNHVPHTWVNNGEHLSQSILSERAHGVGICDVF